VGNTVSQHNADLVAMSGGWTPSVHLTSHRGIRPVYKPELSSFVPGAFDRAHFGAGSMVGTQTMTAAIQSGWEAARQAAQVFGKPFNGDAPRAPDSRDAYMAFTGVGPIATAILLTRVLSIFRTMSPPAMWSWHTAKATNRWST
jgi:hypothetical protein